MTEPISSEREQVVREVLQQLDPLLDLRWMPYVRYDPRTDRLEGRYALICQWPQSDRRWQMHQSGEIGEPYDVIGYYEADAEGMRWFDDAGLPVDPDLVIDRTLELLASMDNMRTSWKDRLRKAAADNAELRRKRSAQVTEETIDGLVDHRRQVQKIPFLGVGARFDALGNIVHEA